MDALERMEKVHGDSTNSYANDLRGVCHELRAYREAKAEALRCTGHGCGGEWGLCRHCVTALDLLKEVKETP